MERKVDKHLFITGANRGIGLCFVKEYLFNGWRVTACCRDPSKATQLLELQRTNPQLLIAKLDLEQLEQTNLNSLQIAKQKIDLVIHNAGYYGPKGVNLAEINLNEWRKVLEVNTIAPLLLTHQLFQAGHLSNLCTIAFVSSKVGSMADNRSGGGYYYRSSKAALNSIVKSLAIDLLSHNIKTVALHPGWVKTDMGGPNALIDPETSVIGMQQVINSLTKQQSGSFIDYQGKTIPW